MSGCLWCLQWQLHRLGPSSPGVDSNHRVLASSLTSKAGFPLLSCHFDPGISSAFPVTTKSLLINSPMLSRFRSLVPRQSQRLPNISNALNSGSFVPATSDHVNGGVAAPSLFQQLMAWVGHFLLIPIQLLLAQRLLVILANPSRGSPIAFLLTIFPCRGLCAGGD
ncbi:hypothetical protein SUGI_0193420 [Cryptomeria japonica]|nr:hypothetical protein SUGI_0193420 [Cryptomeria japonica]